MDRRVYLLALPPLAFGTGAFGFTAVLEPLAADLDVTIGEAGQIASALAVTLAFTAPALAAATMRLERRALLAAALLAYALACAACALAPDYPSLVGFRVGAGLAGALTGPVASALAASLVPPELRGRALAISSSGIALSFILGSPLSAWAGDAFGWRAAFAVAAALALVTAVLMRFALPRVAGALVRPRLGALARVAARRDVAPWLLATGLAFMATQCTIAYLAPVARLGAGVDGAAVGAVQACIGFGCLLGLVVGGRAAARAGVVLPAFFVVVALTQIGYVFLLLQGAPGPASVVELVALVLLGAAALFGTGPVVQSRLVQAVGPTGAAFALALNMSMIFLGQGLGAALGGLIVDRFGLAWVGAAGAGVALLALGFVWLAERRPSPATEAAPA